MTTLPEQAARLAASLPNLLLAAERLAYVAAPGLHGRRNAGPGDAFWQFRDWRDGDELRRIDWRRSAMGDVLLLRERETSVQSVIVLQLEPTPGLAFRSMPELPTKRDRAILLLLALAALLLRSGERVALAGATPPLSGQRALLTIATALGTAGLNAPHLPATARHVIFGDFLTPNPVFTKPAGGAIVQILDPAECDFPYHGRVIFEGFGAEPPVEAANAESWGDIYRARFAAQRHDVAQAAMSAGQTPLLHRTDAPPATALAALYQALRQA